MSWKNRKKGIGAFGLFLLFMAICYLAAKGIYTSAMPRVDARTLMTASITHRFEIYGSLRQGQEYGVYVPQGLRVATIYAYVGEEVTAGTPLFLVDTEDLKKLITEKEIEIARLKEEDADYDSMWDEANVKLARAKEDYEITVKTVNADVERQNIILNEAVGRLNKHQNQKPSMGTVSGSDVSSVQTLYESTLSQLEQEVQNARCGAEDTVKNGENKVLQAKRNLEDANRQRNNLADDPTKETASALNLQYQEEQLKQLQQILEAGGIVTAGEDGMLTASNLTVGDRTRDQAGFVYTKKEDMKILEIPLSEEAQKYVRIRDVAELKFTGERGEWSLTKQVDYVENGMAVFYLEDDSLSIGQGAVFSFSKKSGQYTCCIPIEAINFVDENSGYVYVVEEKEGFFGQEYTVRKEEVTVLDYNDHVAAIREGDVGYKEKIVVDTTKELEEGAVIRVD